MPVQMFDSTIVGAIPADAPAVAGYIGGPWPTYVQLLQRFPRAHHLSIAVNASEDAECLDIEYLDATPDQAPAWVKRQLARGVERPVVYASVSAMPSVLTALQHDGIAFSSVRIWTAHYTGTAHLCVPQACGPGLQANADATQWTDHALDSALDESLCADTFFGPPPPPPDPHHYDWYSPNLFSVLNADGTLMHLDERALVQQYDHLRIHSRMNAARLSELQPLLILLRKYVWYLAHYDASTGEQLPQLEWDLYQRAWRWQMLLARSRGEVVAQ
jgi:hypothetical protein